MCLPIVDYIPCLCTLLTLAGAAALTPLWLPAVAGGLLGCLASAAGVVGARRLWRAPDAPLRVVITGGSSGIGKALAREFLRQAALGPLEGRAGQAWGPAGCLRQSPAM